MVKGHAGPEGRARTLSASAIGHIAALGVLAGAAALSMFGCGSSGRAKRVARPSSPPTTVCTSAARGVIASYVHVALASIVSAESTSSQGAPQCVYRAASRRVTVTVIVDSGAQPYFRLERTIVEAGQQFGTVRVEAAPVTVTHLGLDAAWFPTERHVMTTDGRRLITAAVAWRRASVAGERALSIAVARTYLQRH